MSEFDHIWTKFATPLAMGIDQHLSHNSKQMFRLINDLSDNAMTLEQFHPNKLKRFLYLFNLHNISVNMSDTALTYWRHHYDDALKLYKTRFLLDKELINYRTIEKRLNEAKSSKKDSRLKKINQILNQPDNKAYYLKLPDAAIKTIYEISAKSKKNGSTKKILRKIQQTLENDYNRIIKTQNTYQKLVQLWKNYSDKSQKLIQSIQDKSYAFQKDASIIPSLSNELFSIELNYENNEKHFFQLAENVEAQKDFEPQISNAFAIKDLHLFAKYDAAKNMAYFYKVSLEKLYSHSPFINILRKHTENIPSP